MRLGLEIDQPDVVTGFPRGRGDELETERLTGRSCSEPAGTCWESSGIIDASRWLGSGTWLFDVQAHTLPFSYRDGARTVQVSRESGQLLLLRLPGS